MTRAAWTWIFASLALAAGCGDAKCKNGQTQCASDTLIRTCVAGQWFVHDCGAGARCAEAGATHDAGVTHDAGANGSGSSAGAMCLGDCTAGQSECLSDTIARYCQDGRA